MHKVELRKVEFDIIEREYEFVLLNESKPVLWARSISLYYIDSGYHCFEPTVITDADIYIEFVLEVDPVEDDASPMLVQERKNSSLRCIGIIEKVISEFSFICNVGEAGSILVELEVPINNLREDMRVTFTGGLFIEFDDEFMKKAM